MGREIALDHVLTDPTRRIAFEPGAGKLRFNDVQRHHTGTDVLLGQIHAYNPAGFAVNGRNRIRRPLQTRKIQFLVGETGHRRQQLTGLQQGVAAHSEFFNKDLDALLGPDLWRRLDRRRRRRVRQRRHHLLFDLLTQAAGIGRHLGLHCKTDGRQGQRTQHVTKRTKAHLRQALKQGQWIWMYVFNNPSKRNLKKA